MGMRQGVLLITAAICVLATLVLLLGTPAIKFPHFPQLAWKQQAPLASVRPSPTPVFSSDSAAPSSTSTSTPSEAPHEQLAEAGKAVNMTLTANKFTPEVLLSAPRRSAAKPNELGTAALYTVSTYSFESHSKNTEIRLFDIASRESTLVTNEEKVSEPNWLEGEILFLRGGKNGSTELVIANAADGMKTYTVGIVPAPVSDLKLKSLDNGQVAVVVAGKTTPDGKLYNPETAPKKHHTGMLYDSLIVRHWDHYIDENRNSLWHGRLTKATPHITEKTGRWSLSELNDALAGTDLESPVEPFPGGDHFDLSQYGIGFVAKAPDLDPAYNTRTDFYFVSIPDFTKSSSAKPKKAEIDGLEGASTAPTFSADGKTVAYLSMKTNGYEADKNRIILIQNVTTKSALNGIELLKSDDGKGLWDRSPSKLVWANGKKRLLILAEDKGTTPLFKLDVEDLATKTRPVRVVPGGHISEVNNLSLGRLFLSGNSLVDNSIWSIVDPEVPEFLVTVSSNSRNGAAFGLSPSQISNFWYAGANGVQVQAWVVKPSSNAPKPTGSKKWPLALLIHGGPQGAWGDSWSTRWNPAVFAEQGYYVIMPNPTGSTSYGQKFTDDINQNWGGLPYEDIAKVFDYVDNQLADTVDNKRVVGLGASYGGYMMNWIQGHSLASRFSALVCHDGIFSMANAVSQDEQYFPIHDMGGTFWSSAREQYDKWDPARFTQNWSTPALIIHSDKDFRLPISEGLAAFNVLQGKGVESRFLTFPDENHWVLSEENSLVWHTVVLNWINKFVGLAEYRDEKEVLPVSGRRWGRSKGTQG